MVIRDNLSRIVDSQSFYDSQYDYKIFVFEHDHK